MWLAHCGYVQNLIDPIQFEDIMNTVKWSNNSANTSKKQRLNRRNGYCVGRDRYAAEHWIYSHPSVKPCDVHPDIRYLAGYGAPNNADQIEWDLKLGLRYNMSTFNRFYGRSGEAKLAPVGAHVLKTVF
jgi:hypothetical protein